MASGNSSMSETQICTALSSIPDSLRGPTWLAISELALVAQVPEASLGSMLRPLRTNDKKFSMLRIEKASEQVEGRVGKRVLYYRPYAGMAVRVGHCMSNKEGRAASEASKSTELRAALARVPSQAVQLSAPTLLESGSGAVDNHFTRQKGDSKRLKTSTDESSPTFKRAESSEPAKAAASKKTTRPGLPHWVSGYLTHTLKDGGRVYFIFSEDYSALERSIVFTSPKPVGNGGTAQQQKWEVDYKVSICGTLVHQNRIRAVTSSSLQSQVHSMLESVGSAP